MGRLAGMGRGRRRRAAERPARARPVGADRAGRRSAPRGAARATRSVRVAAARAAVDGALADRLVPGAARRAGAGGAGGGHTDRLGRPTADRGRRGSGYAASFAISVLRAAFSPRRTRLFAVPSGVPVTVASSGVL